jgi:trk system potassium uptake protein TrkH
MHALTTRLTHPSAVLVLAFLAAIAVGTGLLSLPIARAEPGAAPLLTALFTATSAVCVTGLVVVDTGTYWSGFGQAVIMGLFQVGGFGIMTAATLLGLLVNRQLRLRSRLLLQAETHSLGLGDVRSVARLVLVVTVVVDSWWDSCSPCASRWRTACPGRRRSGRACSIPSPPSTTPGSRPGATAS